MMLPKIEEAVAENVQIQAMRDIVKYMQVKAKIVSDENEFLTAAIHGMAKEIAKKDDVLYKRVYLSMLVVADIINTQIEVNDLKSWN